MGARVCVRARRYSTARGHRARIAQRRTRIKSAVVGMGHPLCSPFSHAIRDGRSPVLSPVTGAASNDEFWGLQCSPFLPTSSSAFTPGEVQQRLYKLARDILRKGTADSNRTTPHMWGPEKASYPWQGLFAYTEPTASQLQTYLAAPAKNGLTTLNQCIRWKKPKSLATDQLPPLRKNATVSAIVATREPISRFMSSLSEIDATYPWLTAHLGRPPDLANFLEAILLSNETCRVASAASWCHGHTHVSHRSHSSTWGWVHLWPQQSLLGAVVSARLAARALHRGFTPPYNHPRVQHR